MPYNPNDPAVGSVKSSIQGGTHPQDAYYEAFKPNRNKTVNQQSYEDAVAKAVAKLGTNFSRCEVQGTQWMRHTTPAAAAAQWRKSGGLEE